MTGKEILEAAKKLVMEELARSPDGLRNRGEIERTGLYLDVPAQKGYITWTILQYLVQEGRVEKHGGVFTLKK
jgi:hypothetical protein